MLPSIVRETAVTIEGMIRCSRADPAGSSRLSTAPTIRGRSKSRNNVKNTPATAPRIRLKPEIVAPTIPPAKRSIVSATCFTFSWLFSGAWLCWSIQEPIDELRTSCTIEGKSSTRSRTALTNGAIKTKAKTIVSTAIPSTMMVAAVPRRGPTCAQRVPRGVRARVPRTAIGTARETPRVPSRTPSRQR